MALYRIKADDHNPPQYLHATGFHRPPPPGWKTKVSRRFKPNIMTAPTSSAPSSQLARCQLVGTPDEKKKQLIEYTKHAKIFMDNNARKTIAKEDLKHYLDSVLEVINSEGAVERAAKAIVAHIQQSAPNTYADAAKSSQASPTRLPTRAELNGTWKEREIKIRMFSQEERQRLQAQPKKEDYIRQVLNKRLEKEGFETRIEAVRMLKTGENIFAYTTTTKGKSELMERMDDWKDVLGEGAAISPQVFPIIMSNVNILDTNPFEPHTILDKLLTSNKDILPTDTKIRKTFWLSKPKPNAISNALVIEFMDGKLANTILQKERIVWDGALKVVQRFDPQAKITQCHKCWGYRHVQASFQLPRACGYCTSLEHTTEEHKEDMGMKYAGCGKPHPAWTIDCSARKERMSVIESAKRQLKQSPFFQLPMHMQNREINTRAMTVNTPKLPQHRTFNFEHATTRRFAVNDNSSPMRSGRVLEDGYRVPQARKTKRNTGIRQERGSNERNNPYERRYNNKRRRANPLEQSNRFNVLASVSERDETGRQEKEKDNNNDTNMTDSNEENGMNGARSRPITPEKNGEDAEEYFDSMDE